MEKLLRELHRHGISVDKAYVFGRYARGDWLWDSDVDVVLVSRSFESIPYLARLEKVYSIQGKLGQQPWVEVIPPIPGEFQDKINAPTLLSEAREYWVRVPLDIVLSKG